MVIVPLSVSGDPTSFAAALEAHRAALEAHRAGPAGQAAPVPSHAVLDSLIARVRRGDPEPDAFEIAPYRIEDDTPRSAEAELAIRTLRETLA